MPIYPIEFINPPEYVGLSGTQEVSDDTFEVIAVKFDNGDPVPGEPPYSYKVKDA